MLFHETVFKALSTRLKAVIAAHFLSSPPKMSEREIAAELKISHMSVNRAVNELFAMNFLKVTRAGRVNLWELNEASFSHRVIKNVLLENKEAIQPLDSLLKTLKNGLKNSVAVKAVLFGSVSRGEEAPGSDIDLLVAVKAERDKKEMEQQLEKLGMDCIVLYGNPLSPIVLTEKEFRQSRNRGAIKEAEKGIKIM
jgi:predicted nucleotidyltransferase